MSNKKAIDRGKRHLITMDRQLADKIGYIGTVVVMPVFLRAVVQYLLTGRTMYPRTFHYAGYANAELRKKFNIPEPEKNAYE